ncbi:siderophore-mediated iron transport protein [Bordetella ansorpii]|uniref:Protein TonB n=1 Tax=Bordetella ansorpii TaxID=288768 RepID=A0A157SV95_9BORD|nr:energy transducer TonB [Bordetella ansorpii]SAI74367.1 siderophore-mediated iron transport protein [Bordetella ansorpii]
MPSPQYGRYASSSSLSSLLWRGAAGVVILALHVGVVAVAYYFGDTEPPQMLEQEPVMVSVIEAPEPQLAQAQPEPPPPPPVEEPPPPPPPVEEPPPPEPEPEVEPEPEPEPIIEKPVEPAPKPKPKPKPKPQPKPQPKPEPKPEPKPQPETPPPPSPVGEQKVTQAPRQAPEPSEPEMLSNVQYAGGQIMPNYPSISRRMREEGRVVVLVDINKQGLVDSARIDASSGFPRLDEEALKAARKQRFTPYMRNGVAMPARARLPYVFTMRN